MRSARRDEEVYQTEQIRVDVDLPSWTDDDGTEHPARVREGVSVLGESREIRGKTSSAASELVVGMLEQGLEGEDAALPLLEVVELDGCPIKERALRGYAGGHSPPAQQAAALGFRSWPAEREKGKKGNAPLLLWIATPEELEAELDAAAS